MKSNWDVFLSGFFGSFKLVAAIVMAVVGVLSAFVNGALDSPSRRGDKSAPT
jgi:hypothetical protein